MLASFLASLLILPIGIIQAISNKQIGLNVVMEFIFGLIEPGNPLGNATFKTYGYMAVSQCLALISDMKLGHYMKIPPRSLFIAQLYGTLISAVVNYGVFDFLIRNNPQIWYGAHNEPLSDPQWRSTSPRIFYTASLIWGGVGSLRQFGPGSLYSPILWFFLGGALIPIPFYLLYRRFPTAGFQYIHWPIILESVGSTADGTANALLPATLVAFTFQYGLRVYRRYWYDVYNYTLSAALDSGTILAAALIYLGLILPGASEHYGWNPVHPNPLVWQTPEYCYNSTAI
jgi:OPT family oligopeptide transporter